MRVHIIAVGRLKAGPHQAVARYYIERLKVPPTIREVEEKRRLSPPELREREGALLLGAVPAGATMMALDGHGTTLTSEALAQFLGRLRDGGVSDLACLIGGAEGLSDAVRRKAQLVLSLGPLTWPHFLVRAMLLEQLYRTQQILAGHPYHRG